MGQINLSGALTAGPSGGGDTFPASQFLVPIGFRSGAKSFGVATGILTQIVNSPAAFIELTGVGPTAAVTQGEFLYLKADGIMVLRLTTDDGAGSTEVQTVPIHGLAILEFPTTRPLELLEIKGSGKLEYFVSGQS